MEAQISQKVFLKRIPEIDGWGVFTKERIQAGDCIETSPVFLYPKRLIDLAIFVSMGEGIKDSEIGIDRYAVMWGTDERGVSTAAIMLGYLSLYNHSNKNNSQFVVDTKNKLAHVVAISDIEADEQITVSYGPDWFKQKSYINYIEF